VGATPPPWRLSRRAASCPGETAGETAWVEMVQQRPRQKGRKVFSGGHLALRRGNRRAGVREEVVAHVAAMRGPGREIAEETAQSALNNNPE
jgi:hypothetical protein